MQTKHSGSKACKHSLDSKYDTMKDLRIFDNSFNVSIIFLVTFSSNNSFYQILEYLIWQTSCSVFSRWNPTNPPIVLTESPEMAYHQLCALIQRGAGTRSFQSSIISPISWSVSEKADNFPKASKDFQAQPLGQNERQSKKITLNFP